MQIKRETDGVHEIALNKQERQISVLGGGVLAAVGVMGLVNGKLPSAILAALGSAIIYTGIKGEVPFITGSGDYINNGKSSLSRQVSVPHGAGIKVVRSITVNRPAAELYQFWRNFDNLARFLKHVQSVTVIDERRSHWVIEGPAGKLLEWDAEIINEVENERIGWRSLQGSQIENAGSVSFRTAPGERGTEVRVEINYVPPAGRLGKLLAKLFNGEANLLIAQDIYRFKQLMETGEIASTENQPTCRE
jgi:uncharacterized membrane protein